MEGVRASVEGEWMPSIKRPAVGRVRAAATNDQTRRTNLSLVLSLVHRHGALSRADLTRATGLNRSTVATLTAHLTDLGLVYQAAPTGNNQIGRPSPIVHANPATVALTINPEIDAITIGLVGLGGRVIKRIRYETEHIPSAQEVVNMAGAVIEGMRSELDMSYRVVGIGLAVPGLTRAEDGLVRYAPHLGWRDEPLAERLQAATGYPVWASNDASLGARAELIFGAGRGVRDLIYLNGGASGIGGGVINAGYLLTGSAGYAGELGHTLVTSAGQRCHCGATGCLETEVSLARLKTLTTEPVEEFDELEQALSSSTDPAVMAEVHRQVDFLAIALRNAINVFNPERIVLGGFLALLFALAPERLIERARADALPGPAQTVTITRALLGSNILMIGAAELVFSGLLADPTIIVEQLSS